MHRSFFSRSAMPNRWLRHSTEDSLQEPEICTTWNEYLAAVLMALFLAAMSVLLLIFWLMNYRGGFTSMKFRLDRSKNNEMNFHAIFMASSIMGFSLLGILAFRILCIYPYKARFIIHIISFVGACILMWFGYYYMREMIIGSKGVPEADFRVPSSAAIKYGLHSSVGFVTAGIYGGAAIFGVLSFIGLKEFFRGMHRSAGIAAFAHAGLAVVSGYAQRQHIIYREKHIAFTPEAYISNLQQFFVLISVMLVLIILWRRELRDLNAVIVPDYAL